MGFKFVKEILSRPLKKSVKTPEAEFNTLWMQAQSDDFTNCSLAKIYNLLK